MTLRDVIENKISSMRKFLGLLNCYRGYSKDEIQEDIDLKGAVERYLRMKPFCFTTGNYQRNQE